MFLKTSRTTLSLSVCDTKDSPTRLILSDFLGPNASFFLCVSFSRMSVEIFLSLQSTHFSQSYFPISNSDHYLTTELPLTICHEKIILTLGKINCLSLLNCNTHANKLVLFFSSLLQRGYLDTSSLIL